MKIRFVFSLVLIMSLSFACSKSHNENVENVKNPTQQSTQNNTPDAQPNNPKNSQGVQEGEFKTLSKQEIEKKLNEIEEHPIVKTFPTGGFGIEKLKPDFGSINISGVDCKTVSCMYKHAKGNLIIQVIDFGKKGNVPQTVVSTLTDLRVDEKLMEVNKLKTADYFGYKGKYKNKPVGKLSVIAFDRFQITIDYRTLPENCDDVEKIFKMIKIKDLKKIK